MVFLLLIYILDYYEFELKSVDFLFSFGVNKWFKKYKVSVKIIFKKAKNIMKV